MRNSTLTFIRNNRRDAFTFVREDGTYEELTFLEAVKEFEARMDEKPIPLHELHHQQVAKAIEVFSDREEDAKAIPTKVNIAQGPNEKKAIAYLDGFMSIPNITDEECELINKAKRAITTGKFQQLQRDVNKLKSSTKKTPIKLSVLLEKLITIITAYPLDAVDLNDTKLSTNKVVLNKKEINPEIIISESFNS